MQDGCLFGECDVFVMHCSRSQTRTVREVALCAPPPARRDDQRLAKVEHGNVRLRATRSDLQDSQTSPYIILSRYIEMLKMQFNERIATWFVTCWLRPAPEVSTCFVISTYSYIHIYIYIYTHIHTYIHTHIHTRNTLYVCVYIYIYVYIHISIYMYMYIERERERNCGVGCSRSHASWEVANRRAEQTSPFPKKTTLSFGWHYLSNAPCLIRPHLFYTILLV